VYAKRKLSLRGAKRRACTPKWRYGTQAWQSDEVVARAKPVAISRDLSLRSGQGLLHGVYPEPGHKRFFAPLRMTKSEEFAMTFFRMSILSVVHHSFGIW
jgi:hypothetical protein